MNIRVLIADDHPVVLSGLEMVLRQEPGFELAAKCSDGEAVVMSIVQKKPDVALVDLHMPKKDGLVIMRELQAISNATPVVLLTGTITEEEVMEALKLGVRGILLKEMAPRLLLECLRKVHGGGQWLEKASISKVIERMLKREEASQRFGAMLTKRELEILRLVAQGLTNDDIAERLFIAAGTVKIHVHSIFRKVGVSGRAELTRFAKEKGLV